MLSTNADFSPEEKHASSAASLLIFMLTGSLTALPAASDPRLLGFTTQSEPGEVSWEQRFKLLPDPQRMRANMERLSARPHHVGSPYDKENAEWILAQYKQWGWDAHIEEFQVLFPTPKMRLLEMIEPAKFSAKLEEPAVAVDPTSKQKDEQLPTYNAYSPDGDVTAPLVYVNYGSTMTSTGIRISPTTISSMDARWHRLLA
jgi:N-acetylated-alpha-linked acidic dipeptidase